MFIDQATIRLHAGSGGNGCKAFRREIYIPKGGPAGGDGGCGGSIWFQADKSVRTLGDIWYHKTFRADSGKHGLGQNKTGRSAEDRTILLPAGTIIKDENGNVLCDLAELGQKFLAAKGGKGGLGNQNFATPTHQTPTKTTPGEQGEDKILRLELKLLADVGLVGKPNAGKSTLICSISKAKSKIADYPFTTLEPVLGVVSLPGETSLVMADIPGLIEGASRGKGLGHKFLKHIERTKSLLYLIDINEDNPFTVYSELKQELRLFNEDMLLKKEYIALTKCDTLIDPSQRKKKLRGFGRKKTLFISAQSSEGLDELKTIFLKLIS